jgi:hypothetical protein
MDNTTLLIITAGVAIVVLIICMHDFNKLKIMKNKQMPVPVNNPASGFSTNTLRQITAAKLESIHNPLYTVPRMNSMNSTYIHPSLMSDMELEEFGRISGFGVGPGLVEGDRFRGNFNI